MPRGGMRSTSWTPKWKSGKTVLVRIPAIFEAELLQIAKVWDERGEVENTTLAQKNVLKESANAFLTTIPLKERLKAKNLLYAFIESVPCSNDERTHPSM